SFFTPDHPAYWKGVVGSMVTGAFEKPDLLFWVESEVTGEAEIRTREDLLLCHRALYYLPGQWVNISQIKAVILSEGIGSPAGKGCITLNVIHSVRPLESPRRSDTVGRLKAKTDAREEAILELPAVLDGLLRIGADLQRLESLGSAFRAFERALGNS